MAKPLTPQRRKLLKGIAEGKTQKQAAIDAGYSPKTAEVIGSRIVKTERERFLVLMDKAGLSDSKICKAHAELMGANRTISVIPAKGETEGRDATGSSVEFVDVPDWQARAKGIDMAHKIKGRYVERKEVSGPNGDAIPVRFTVKFVGE